MSFSAPTLPRFPTRKCAGMAVVMLSQVRDCLIVRVPEPNDIPPNWDVYPIIGAAPEEPDWQGVEEPTGFWDDEIEDMVQRNGIELKIPKAELVPYLGTKIELHYKFADESSLEPSSEPLVILIES